MTSQHARTNARRRMTSRAFTLIEMLTVIGILAILIAIIIPSINGARNAARKTDTRTQMTSVTQAVAAFQIDNRRLPGYFSPRQMGSIGNSTAGFTTMDNMLIDLLGGITTQATNGTTIIDVGWDSAATGGLVRIDKDTMGSTKQSSTGAISKSYMPFDQKRFVVQSAPGARFNTTVPGNVSFPSLVDSFGQPILAWVGDDAPSAGTFSHIDASAAAPNGARFYQVQNAGFLNATALGKAKQDQRSDVTNKLGSALCLIAAPSGPAVSTVNVQDTLAALLGNASVPDPALANRPLAPRAPLVLHSAGLDGTYVGLRDKGARSGSVQYAPNADPFGGGLFDDIIVSGGN